MSGELYNAGFQVGVESPYGTPVAATRKMYWRNGESKLSRVRDPRVHKFATQDRFSTRKVTFGPQKPSGVAVLAASADEIIELLLMTICGAVTPTGAGAAKLWTFAPGSALDSATVEWHDGARAWQMAGALGNSIKFAGSISGEHIVTANLVGSALALNALTGGLTDRLPSFLEGWEAAMYIDALGGTPGSTLVSDTIINWDVDINNGMEPKFLGNNTNAVSRYPLAELEAGAKLTLEAISSDVATELSALEAGTERLVRLVFGNNLTIPVNEIQTLTVDATGGTFTITYAGQTTAAIAFDAAAAAVQSALEALSNIAPGDVACTGGPCATAPVICTFGGTLANTDVALMTTDPALLTGGAQTATIVETCKGGPQKTYIKIDLPGAWTVVDLGGEDAKTRVYAFDLQPVYDSVNAFMIRILVNNTRATAW